MSQLLRYYEEEGNGYVEIPDEYWKCPRCNTGHEGGCGLVDEDDREQPSEGVYFLDSELHCNRCDSWWDANDLYSAAVRKSPAPLIPKPQHIWVVAGREGIKKAFFDKTTAEKYAKNLGEVACKVDVE